MNLHKFVTHIKVSLYGIVIYINFMEYSNLHFYYIDSFMAQLAKDEEEIKATHLVRPQNKISSLLDKM